MIKLNLASRPGLCEEGKLTPLFLKNNFYKEEVIGAATEGESVLKVGEAEKEEFVPKHTSLPPKKVKKDEQVVGKKRSFAPFLYFMLVIIVVGGGYWLYKTKLSPITSFSVTKKPEVEKPAVLQLEEVTTVETEKIPVKQILYNEITDAAVNQITRGIGVLSIGVNLLNYFPAGSNLRYLRVKGGKASFILYVPVNEDGVKLKNSLASNAMFSVPDVFYIDRDDTYPGYPYQVMSILDYKAVILKSDKAYKYKIDEELARILTNSGSLSNVSLTPLRIFQTESDQPLKAQFTGKGNLNSCLNFFGKLMELDVNLCIECIYIFDNTNKALDTTILEFKIDTVIFPRRPQI